MLRKIVDIKPPCLHPEHNPPSMIVLPDGVYAHTCPGCGQTMSFVVANTIWCTTHSGTHGNQYISPVETTITV